MYWYFINFWRIQQLNLQLDMQTALQNEFIATELVTRIN